MITVSLWFLAALVVGCLEFGILVGWCAGRRARAARRGIPEELPSAAVTETLRRLAENTAGQTGGRP